MCKLQTKVQQAQRVKDFMNYQIMDQMKEYEPEFDSNVISFTACQDQLLKKFTLMK